MCVLIPDHPGGTIEHTLLEVSDYDLDGTNVAWEEFTFLIWNYFDEKTGLPDERSDLKGRAIPRIHYTLLSNSIAEIYIVPPRILSLFVILAFFSLVSYLLFSL